MKSLTAKQSCVLRAAIKNGYIVNTAATKEAAIAYGNWCKKNCRPNIEIQPKRKYSCVRIDFITVPSNGYSEESIQELERLLIGKHNQDLEPKSFLALDGVYAFFYIKNEFAQEMAEEMWKLARSD
jgi:hypothetical protein